MTHELTASFVTLSGAGFAQPARIPFPERCRAAAAAGFAAIGLHNDDYQQMLAAGIDNAAVQNHLDRNGIELREVEFLSGWTNAPDNNVARHAAAGALAMGAAFSPHHVTAGELTGGPLNVDVAGARLRAVCDLVLDAGLKVAVEAFPWSALSNVAAARAVIEASGATNAGLMIDIWHFYNSRSTLADLDGLRPDQIVAMQLNDGRIVADDFLAEARQGRLLPGDGDLNVAGLLRGLHERGFRGPYCVEVNYPAFRELAVEEMASLAFTKAKNALTVLA